MPSNLRVLVGLDADEVINGFHRLFYHTLGWDQNTFLGYQIKQNPLDLQVYQELLFATRPRFIVQTGVAGGGSLLYFATLLDLIAAPAETLVIGIDIQLTEPARTLQHPRVRLIEADSVADETLRQVRALLPADHSGGMVVLDSNHRQAHVARELWLYRDFVAVGSYLVVEDTNINGHPAKADFGPGPFEAVEAFLQQDKRFARDTACWSRQLFSFHQHGWLKRVS